MYFETTPFIVISWKKARKEKKVCFVIREALDDIEY